MNLYYKVQYILAILQNSFDFNLKKLTIF